MASLLEGKLGSTFGAAVCKIQAKKHYTESFPSAPKDKRASLKVKGPPYSYLLIALAPWKLVLEPDPQKIEKEGLVNGAGWKCTLRNVRNFINY